METIAELTKEAQAYGVPYYETNEGFFVNYGDVTWAGKDGSFSWIGEVLNRLGLKEGEFGRLERA